MLEQLCGRRNGQEKGCGRGEFERKLINFGLWFVLDRGVKKNGDGKG